MIGMRGESNIRTGVRLADTSRECLFFLVEKFFHPKVIALNRREPANGSGIL